ncbi:hypothetical protein EON66_01620 [archaeon]|nr:MAG: hypothetical protein EON66_01620 [archaeon]
MCHKKKRRGTCHPLDAIAPSSHLIWTRVRNGACALPPACTHLHTVTRVRHRFHYSFTWRRADLSGVFNWNVKQLFVFITADFQTPKNVRSPHRVHACVRACVRACVHMRGSLSCWAV